MTLPDQIATYAVGPALGALVLVTAGLLSRSGARTRRALLTSVVALATAGLVALRLHDVTPTSYAVVYLIAPLVAVDAVVLLRRGAEER